MKIFYAFAAIPLLITVHSTAWAQTSKEVIVINSTARAVPVIPQGTTAVSGAVSLTGNPDVTIANTAFDPVPITGKVEVVSAPPAPQSVYAVRGATQGEGSFPISPATLTSLLVVSSRNRILLSFSSGPGAPLSFEVFPNQTVVLPLAQAMVFRQLDTTCTDPGGLCEFFSVNFVGTPQ